MKVLSVASEAFPLIKTGGLADVVGALPAALAGCGVEMRVMLPGYPAVMSKINKPRKTIKLPKILDAEGRILPVSVDGIDCLILDIPELFDRPGGPYTDVGGNDHADNWRRFAVLSKAAALVADGLIPKWRPDVVHMHDWQAALTPLYMESTGANQTPTVMTVHNLAFQGQFDSKNFALMELEKSAFAMDGLEYYGDISYLKAGLHRAHAITTVSPTYAQEIRTPEFGMGLEGVVNARSDDLYGIVNGIDTDIWNPASDPNIAAPFDMAHRTTRKANRNALIEHFELDKKAKGPIFTLVTRLTWQKGIDLLIEVIDDIVAMGGRLAILGSGDKAFEGALLGAAARHRGQIGIQLGYNEPLSHLLQAGGDAILVPSRFEPCGLTQLYGLRYGCVPVVARTGGLADTVIDANEAALAAGVATGFLFGPVTADGLRQTIRRVVRAFEDKKTWSRIQQNGMRADVSWTRSAERYAQLYQALIEKSRT